MGLEKVVRPLSLDDGTPPRRVAAGVGNTSTNIALQIGRTGSGRTFNGSFSSNTALFCETFENQVPHKGEKEVITPNTRVKRYESKDDPDVWLDVLQLIRLIVTSGQGPTYKKITYRLYWDDDDSNATRKGTKKEIHNPSNEDEFVELTTIDRITFEEHHGPIYQKRHLSYRNAEEDETTRKNKIRRVVHYDTKVDPRDDSRAPYERDKETLDKDQFLDIEQIENVFDNSGQGIDFKKKTAKFRTDAFEDLTQEPKLPLPLEPTRLDPYQKIINVQWASRGFILIRAYGQGDFDGGPKITYASHSFKWKLKPFVINELSDPQVVSNTSGGKRRLWKDGELVTEATPEEIVGEGTATGWVLIDLSKVGAKGKAIKIDITTPPLGQTLTTYFEAWDFVYTLRNTDNPDDMIGGAFHYSAPALGVGGAASAAFSAHIAAALAPLGGGWYLAENSATMTESSTFENSKTEVCKISCYTFKDKEPEPGGKAVPYTAEDFVFPPAQAEGEETGAYGHPLRPLPELIEEGKYKDHVIVDNIEGTGLLPIPATKTTFIIDPKDLKITVYTTAVVPPATVTPENARVDEQGNPITPPP